MSDIVNSNPGVASEPPRRRGRPPRLDKPEIEPVEVEQEAVSAVPRAEMREEVREEDPRIRAARRAAEIRGHIGSLDQGTEIGRAHV